jgi:hypothetical protein
MSAIEVPLLTTRSLAASTNEDDPQMNVSPPAGGAGRSRAVKRRGGRASDTGTELVGEEGGHLAVGEALNGDLHVR